MDHSRPCENSRFYLGVMGVIWSSHGPIVTWSWTNRDLVLEHSRPSDQSRFHLYVNRAEVQLEDSFSRHSSVSGTLSTKLQTTFFTTLCLSVQSLHSYEQSLHSYMQSSAKMSHICAVIIALIMTRIVTPIKVMD